MSSGKHSVVNCMPMTSLNREIETYNRLLPELLTHQGKYVVIKGDSQLGIYDTYQDALTAGYEKFKLEPFLVKQIAPAAQVSYFTRDLVGCRA